MLTLLKRNPEERASIFSRSFLHHRHVNLTMRILLISPNLPVIPPQIVSINLKAVHLA